MRGLILGGIVALLITPLPGAASAQSLEINPALATIILMPLTYSITNGIGAGFILYTLIRLVKGEWRDIHPALYVVTAAFLLYFLRLPLFGINV